MATKSPGGLFRGQPLGLKFFLLCVVSLLLMVVDQREHQLDHMRNGLSVLLYPVRAMVDLPFSAYRWAESNLRSRKMLEQELDRLRDTQLELNARLQRLAALEAENTRLRALMDSSARVAARVLIAEVVSVDLDPYRHRFVIDKGSRSGVYEEQAVVDANGILGQVVSVQPGSAEVILISDPDHALPVAVNRSGLRSIAVGTGDLGELDLPFLPNNADIRKGDLLVSSGLGGAFPPGYPVATVSEVTRQPGEPFARIRAKPAARLDRVREVLLVWPPANDASDADSDEPPQS